MLRYADRSKAINGRLRQRSVSLTLIGLVASILNIWGYRDPPSLSRAIRSISEMASRICAHLARISDGHIRPSMVSASALTSLACLSILSAISQPCYARQLTR